VFLQFTEFLHSNEDSALALPAIETRRDNHVLTFKWRFCCTIAVRLSATVIFPIGSARSRRSETNGLVDAWRSLTVAIFKWQVLINGRCLTSSWNKSKMKQNLEKSEKIHSWSCFSLMIAIRQTIESCVYTKSDSEWKHVLKNRHLFKTANR